MSNLSHELCSESIAEIQERIALKGDLPYASLQQQNEILEKLTSIPLGQFLIQHRGLNGYWTDVVLTRPCDEVWKDTGLEVMPIFTATCQRYQIFKSYLQQLLRPGMHCASIPSGLMSEYLTLDLDLSQIKFDAIDLDAENFSLLQERAALRAADVNCRMMDAWTLDECELYDVITSNGLNIYVSDEQKVIELYQKFCDALKPNGVLIVSALTPPPTAKGECEWTMDKINQQGLLLQKIVFVDILQAKWQHYRTSASTIAQLMQAGFSTVDVVFDDAKMFPTFIAAK